MTFDDLPLFASDAELGPAILGEKRARYWKGIAEHLERKGLPSVDPLCGGRYRPAVKRFFDNLWNVDTPGVMPVADGVDREDVWTSLKRPG